MPYTNHIFFESVEEALQDRLSKSHFNFLTRKNFRPFSTLRLEYQGPDSNDPFETFFKRFPIVDYIFVQNFNQIGLSVKKLC